MAMEPVLVKGEARDAELPTSYNERDQITAGLSKHGMVIPDFLSWRQRLALMGRYWVLRNAAPGTGLAGHAAAVAFDDEKAVLYIRSDYTAASKKLLYLDYIRLQVVTAAGTSGTNYGIVTALDQASTARYSADGTALVVANRVPYMASGEDLEATVYAGKVTAAAESANMRVLFGQLIRNVIPVIGDSYEFVFGRDGNSDGGGEALNGTAPVRVTIAHPPVVLGPGEQFLLHEFSASQGTARNLEFEIGLFAL